MKIFRTTLALLIAASVLALAGCRSRKTNPTLIPDASGESSEAGLSRDQDRLDFTTADMNGKTVSFEDYSSAKVIMFNMWEPWCGPCRGELPDLQKLYQKYKSEGLLIVGVYSDSDGLKDIVKENKIRYPMIKSCPEFDRFQTGYVPTTVFTDGEGNVLSDEPYVGSKSYDDWEQIILSYLR